LISGKDKARHGESTPSRATVKREYVGPVRQQGFHFSSGNPRTMAAAEMVFAALLKPPSGVGDLDDLVIGMSVTRSIALGIFTLLSGLARLQ
jgi:hypothetical protein